MNLEQKLQSARKRLMRNIKQAFVDKEARGRAIKGFYLNADSYELYVCEYILKYVSKESREQKRMNYREDEGFSEKLSETAKTLLNARSQLFG